jgi:hypothetical protein
LLLKNAPAVLVVVHAFTLYFMPPDVLLEIVSAKDTDTVAATPEGGVSDDDR